MGDSAGPTANTRISSPEQSSGPRTPWHPVTRAVFRFAFVWFVVTNLPFPLRVIPLIGPTTGYYNAAWGGIASWVATHVVRLGGPISSGVGSSSDRIFDWLLAATFLCVSAMGAAIWSIADRRRLEYRLLHDRLRVYVRFALASVLLGYGLVKIFPEQFLFPGNDVLVEPYGRSSPMRLLWTFMGYSRAYATFGGVAEIVPAFLLFWRRTALLGALMAAAVLTNVVMINFSYDVPVKLWSIELLATAIFLLVPDARRLVDVFVLHRPTTPAPSPPPPSARWGRIGERVIMAALASSAMGEGLRTLRNFSSDTARPALYGIYEVDAFERDGETLPPLLTDKTRWRRLVINRWGTVTIVHMDDTQEWFQLHDDASLHLATLTSHGEKDTSFELSYARESDASLRFEGAWQGARVRVATRRVEDSSFLLVSRGFRWVSESPFNR